MPEAFFLPVSEGLCFCLFHAPEGEVRRGCILYLHPFAEALNTTRRIVAQQARAFARIGYGVLQIDLPGCGDSTGEFEDASWAVWIEAAAAAGEWLQEKISGPFWIWGLRSGTLLAAAVGLSLQKLQHRPVNFLFWQPVGSGRQMLQQFLRLHSASEWLGQRDSQKLSATQMLEQGKSVEISGYILSAKIFQELSRIQLLPCAPCVHPGTKLIWFEVSSHPNPVFSPSSEKIISEWKRNGWKVEAQIIIENVFWQTINDADTPLLCSATENSLLRSNF